MKHTVFFPRLDGSGMALVRRSIERLGHGCAEGHRCLHDAGREHPPIRIVLGPLAEMHRVASLTLHRIATDVGQSHVPFPPLTPPICFRYADLHEAAARHDLAALLAECELGERALSRLYRETLDAPVPPPSPRRSRRSCSWWIRPWFTSGPSGNPMTPCPGAPEGTVNRSFLRKL